MAETAQLDSFDIQILRALRSDGRLSVQNLSELIGLSPTPTARRLKRLEEAGIIKGYSALIDEVALGYTVTVFVSVQLDRQVDDALASFEAAIDAFPGVRSSAVIGLPDDDMGNLAHGIVDAPDGIDLEALQAYLADTLSRYKIPRTFEVVTEPVRDDAGKVRRSQLRADRISN